MKTMRERRGFSKLTALVLSSAILSGCNMGKIELGPVEYVNASVEGFSHTPERRVYGTVIGATGAPAGTSSITIPEKNMIILHIEPWNKKYEIDNTEWYNKFRINDDVVYGFRRKEKVSYGDNDGDGTPDVISREYLELVPVSLVKRY